MFTVILILWCSAAAGYALHRYSVPQIGRLITWSVWLLLFLMGKEVGENPVLVQHIGRIGTEALVLALTTCAGCATLSAMVWKRLRRRRDASAQTGATDSGKKQTQTVSIRSQLAESGVIVAFFAIGCVSGRHNWLTLIPPQSSFYALCLLVVCVGFSIGQNREFYRSLRQMDRRLIALPLLTFSGTWAGALLTSCLFTRHSATDWLAASSGFGYYSLSGVLITELRGSELGTLSLIYNILRELIVLLAAPFLCRGFGPLAPISQGGATSGDTTLPIIAAACGNRFVPLSIYHGLTVDFSVPFLVPFFCSLS